MKPYSRMNAEERRAFDRALQTSGRKPLGIDGVLPDGRTFEWDTALQETIEIAADGRQFVVELRHGRLVRTRELVSKTGVA
ncbi:MAG: hypothetical protein WD696_15670 [Bryobacteraceae bacterium]